MYVNFIIQSIYQPTGFNKNAAIKIQLTITHTHTHTQSHTQTHINTDTHTRTHTHTHKQTRTPNVYSISLATTAKSIHSFYLIIIKSINKYINPFHPTGPYLAPKIIISNN